MKLIFATREGRPLHLAQKRVERVTERDAQSAGTLTNAWALYEAAGLHLRLAPRTREGYKSAYRLALADTRLPPKPSTADVEDWMLRLVRQTGLSPVTVNIYKRSIEAVLLRVSRRTHDHTLHDAFAAADKLPEPPRERRAPPDDALVRCEAACDTPAEIAFVRLCAVAALRVGEVMGLKAGDLDNDGILHVVRQRTHDRRKNRKTHHVKLDAVTLRAVRWTSCNHLQLVDGRNRNLRGWLFPWGEPKVASLMEKIRTSLGDDADKYFPRGKTAWHALRHLAGTMTAKKTKDPLAVKRVLGDASLHVAMMYVAEARGETYAACDDLAGDYVKSAQLMLTGRRSGDEPSAPSTVAVDAASVDGGPDAVRLTINNQPKEAKL